MKQGQALLRALLLVVLPSLALLPLLSGCMSAYRKSVGVDNVGQVYSRRYVTDLNTAWQACLEAMKSNPLDVKNTQSGYIQTKWVDNTEQRNFVDSFGDANATLKAQFRFKVNVASTFYNGEPVVKITVTKDQMVQYDVLEGWRYVETDSIDENTLLYRIGRLIYFRMKIAKLEEERINRETKNMDLSK
ncbi:MAG: hypothetical protein ACJ763_20060 [Bdellovibrionia bacterium]